MARQRNRLRTTLEIVAILGAIFAVSFFFGPTGSVRGIEFSPDIFAHRSFRYYQWCGIQITPTRLETWQSQVDNYVHAQGHVDSQFASNPRWHFVKGLAPHLRGWIGPAKPMCQAVGCYSGDDRWIKWSEANPEFARIVWPRVVTWAQNERYYAVSCLFRATDLDTATSAEDVQEMLSHAEELAEK